MRPHSPWVSEANRRADRHPLDVFFCPESVAVIGATEAPGSMGRALMANLIRNPSSGVLYPISRRRHGVLGIKAYPNLAAVPDPVELALVATPAATVPDVLDECLAAGVKAVTVLSAGFGDSGPVGANLESQLRQRLCRESLRVLGVNSLGIACPPTGLNATSAPAMVPRGKVGFLSQSAALLTAILSQEHSEGVGCSCFVSVGSCVDISWAEWLDYLAGDPQTECIGIYMERLDDVRAFFTSARQVAPSKPIILVKGSGVTAGGDAAREEVFEEACRCSGVLRVSRLADLFRMAAHLTSYPPTKGRRLAILTNARGPAILAADAWRASEGSLAALAPQTVPRLADVLTPRWNRQNPIDIGDDGNAARYARAAAAILRDPNVDALLALLAPQTAIDPVQAATELGEVVRVGGKPVLACWLWGAADPHSLAVLRKAGVSVFHSPEAAVRAFGYLCQHAENMRCLRLLNAALDEAEEKPRECENATAILATARQEGRSALTEAEARELLSVHGLTVSPSRVVLGAEEAALAAEAIGYPVLLGLANDPSSGESAGEMVWLRAVDVAGVRRATRTLEMVVQMHYQGAPANRFLVRPHVPATATLLAVHCTMHPDLGPVLRLGEAGQPGVTPTGGTVALLPLTPLAARELIEQGPWLRALRAGAGEAPFDLSILEEFLLRLSRLVVAHPEIQEITLNPLAVWDGGVMARGVHLTLHDLAGEEIHLPRPIVGCRTSKGQIQEMRCTR